MQRNAVLTDSELGYLSELFDQKQQAATSPDGYNHMISVTTEVPQLIASLLGQAKFTLLAEVGHYKLWFPLDMTLDEFGQPNPVLGIPEVVEYSGHERSWRLASLQDIRFCDHHYGDKVQLLSLSSTGLAFKLDCPQLTEQLLQQAELGLTLPDGQQLQLKFEPVRQHNSIIAARISSCQQQRELLRRFLFQRHRQQFPSLYQQLR
ncbi:hypothetical protein [Rheinheimera gaetbuli]